MTSPETGFPPKDVGPDALELTQPDLPGQPGESAADLISAWDEEADTRSFFESDSTEGMGWRGQWVQDLLTKQKQRNPLGVRDKELRWTHDKSWAIDVKLEVSMHHSAHALYN